MDWNVIESTKNEEIAICWNISSNILSNRRKSFSYYSLAICILCHIFILQQEDIIYITKHKCGTNLTLLHLSHLALR